MVFPTHVGVFLAPSFGGMPALRLPHACGGVSELVIQQEPGVMSSPRMWGCFYKLRLLQLHQVVFPTHVGVFLLIPNSLFTCKGLPHACGGVSIRY